MVGIVLISGSPGVAVGLLTRSDPLYPADTVRPVLASLVEDVRLLRDRLAGLVEQSATRPDERGVPSPEPIDGPDLKEIAADLQDLKRQLAAMNSAMGLRAKTLEQAALREPDRSAVHQLAETVKAERHLGTNHDLGRWLLQSVSEVVTRLGRPNAVESEAGRIKYIRYRVRDKPSLYIYFDVGDGVVTSIRRMGS
jgi:hypothetical protein